MNRKENGSTAVSFPNWVSEARKIVEEANPGARVEVSKLRTEGYKFTVFSQIENGRWAEKYSFVRHS